MRAALAVTVLCAALLWTARAEAQAISGNGFDFFLYGLHAGVVGIVGDIGCVSRIVHGERKTAWAVVAALSGLAMIGDGIFGLIRWDAADWGPVYGSLTGLGVVSIVLALWNLALPDPDRYAEFELH